MNQFRKSNIPEKLEFVESFIYHASLLFSRVTKDEKQTVESTGCVFRQQVPIQTITH